MNRPATFGLACLALVSTCFADVPPPPPPPGSTPVGMEVKTAPSSTVTLQIPSDLVRDESSPFRTVVAGLLLAMSIAGGGIWLARRRMSRPAQTALMLAALAVGGTGVMLADLGPRFGRRTRPVSLPATAFRPGSLLGLREVLGNGPLSGTIAVEIVPSGSPIRLVVPAR